MPYPHNSPSLQCFLHRIQLSATGLASGLSVQGGGVPTPGRNVNMMPWPLTHSHSCLWGRCRVVWILLTFSPRIQTLSPQEKRVESHESMGARWVQQPRVAGENRLISSWSYSCKKRRFKFREQILPHLICFLFGFPSSSMCAFHPPLALCPGASPVVLMLVLWCLGISTTFLLGTTCTKLLKCTLNLICHVWNKGFTLFKKSKVHLSQLWC